LKGFNTASAKIGVKLLWKPFKLQFGDTIDELENLLEEVDKEADVAEKEAAAQDRHRMKDHVEGEICIRQ